MLLREFAKTFNVYVLSEGIKDSRKDSMVPMNMILTFFAKIWSVKKALIGPFYPKDMVIAFGSYV